MSFWEVDDHCTLPNCLMFFNSRNVNDLEARAMNAAAAGAVFAARLTIGGKVVRAVALGPGRAVLQAQALQPETGARP